MSKTIQKISYALILAFMLPACQGDVLFRTQPCEDGMVRQGNACVSPTESDVETKKQIVAECLDPDLSDLRQGKKITMCDGSIGEGKLVLSSDIPHCSKDGEQDCVNKSKFKAVDTENFSSADIKNGKVIAGVTGSLRSYKHCRNYSALATFDTSYPPSNLGWTFTFLPAAVDTASDQITSGASHGLITNSPIRFTTTTTLPAPLVSGTTYYVIYVSSTVFQLASTLNGTQIDITTQGTGTHSARDISDGIAQYFDTVDDHNNNQAFSPSNNPWSSDDYLCDASNFVNVSSTSAPLLPSGLTPPTGNQPFTQIWQDQISGIYISNILSVSGSRTWSDAIRTCESLNNGSAGNGWRLPTQKELMQLSIHGISKVPLSGGSTNTLFWSSSGASHDTDENWVVSLAYGSTYSQGRHVTTFSMLCIRSS